MPPRQDKPHQVILVTGPAGAGRGTAIKALEDLDFEAIDNLPMSLVPPLIDSGDLHRPIALGIDTRGRQFSPDALLQLYDQLVLRPDVAPGLLYLDCAPDVLVRRYSETRRRHPLTPTDTPWTGIAQEIALLQSVRARADALIDTSELTPHDLRARIADLFGAPGRGELAVNAVSFSYKRGLPPGADVVFDCRFLKNPHWVPDLRPLTGLDAAVVTYLRQDNRLAPFLMQVLGFADFLLPACKQEGKTHFTIAFGCTGGQHRSVAVTEIVSAALADRGWAMATSHRELERRGPSGGTLPHRSTIGDRQP